VVSLLLLVAGAHCDPALDSRTAFIVSTLVDADRDLIASRPTLVASKYEVMASGLQPFLRGTATLFYRDLSRYQGEQAMIPHGEGTEQTQLYGDVHLENVGVTFDVQGALLDVVDFDATTRGPFGWEVRRAALALREALYLGGVSEEGLDQVVARFAGSYVQTVLDQSATTPTLPTVFREPSSAAGKIITELLADGRKRYDSQEELTQYGEVKDGVRTLLRNEDQQPLPEPWASDLPKLIDSYRSHRHAGRGDDQQFALLDAVQKLNSGVASLPNLRFWVLLRGDSAAPDPTTMGGQWILEFKEERDPPLPSAWLGRGPLGNNGERVYGGTLRLLASPTSEADLGYVSFGGVSFQVRRVLRGRRDLDVAKLSERVLSGRYGTPDLFDLAVTLGRLLGAGHARAGSAADLARVLTAPDGRADEWVSHLIGEAASDQRRLQRDLLLFQQALALRGPLLGAHSP